MMIQTATLVFNVIHQCLVFIERNYNLMTFRKNARFFSPKKANVTTISGQYSGVHRTELELSPKEIATTAIRLGGNPAPSSPRNPGTTTQHLNSFSRFQHRKNTIMSGKHNFSSIRTTYPSPSGCSSCDPS